MTKVPTADMQNSFILKAADVRVERGGALILDVAALAIRSGEVISLIGPNGAGKTTLLQALSRLIRLSRGDIIFQNKKVGTDIELLHYRRCLAMVFQEALLFDATVFNNVAFGLKIRGVESSVTDKIVNAKLEQFGIGHLRDRSAKTLSGGEAQRTSLARAFAIEPQILFLDEPFAALDPPTREALIEDLNRIIRDSGTTAVMATHDQVEALQLSDRIGVMDGGRIAQLGTPVEIMNHPVDEFVASFVGVETIIEGRVIKCERGTATIAVLGNGKPPVMSFFTGMVDNHVAAVEDGKENREVPYLEAAGHAPPGERVLCCVRPEHITLSPGTSYERSSARNVFPAIITRIIPAGAFHKVHLNGCFPLVAYVTVQSLEDLALREGTAVTASFKATAVHMIRRGQPRG